MYVFAVLWRPEKETMALHKKELTMYVFAVLWRPEKEKMAHKKIELKRSMFLQCCGGPRRKKWPTKVGKM
jgi:hypothetical protein